MRILEMSGYFGRLSGETLTLSPGVNCIYAPNETGKSTWGQFLRVMLYGLSTRERGAMADKNRFLPWSGARMRGSLLLELDDGRHCVLRRDTVRAGAPMGEFSCTYEGTATPVEGLTGQNAGEVLLGISREVFERSAFIRQSALAVDQDAELERRIAALITSGEEDVSFSASYERLKKQLTRRRYNKSGLLPQLETDIARLQSQLAQLESLQQQSAEAASQLEDCRAQLQQLRAQQAMWQQLEGQALARRWRDARQDDDAASSRAARLAEESGPLPEGENLTAMEGQLSAARTVQAQLASSQTQLQQAKEACDAADEPYRAHRLYPADEESLRARVSSQRVVPKPSKLLWLLPIGLLALCGAFTYATAMINVRLYPGSLCSAGATIAAAIGVWLHGRKRLLQREAALRQRAELETELAAYLPLRRQAEAAEAAYLHAAAEVETLSRQLLTLTVALGASLQPYCPGAATLDDMDEALALLRQHQTALDAAQREAAETSLRLSLLREHLPREPLPDPDAALPVPETPRQEVAHRLAALEASQQSAQSRLDTLSGQLRACGQRAELTSELAQKQRRQQALEEEYAALALAMDVLSTANTQLQNRFSPALGARAAEIFGAVTGGRYEKVLLSRSFAIEAETPDDPVGRSIQLLSQGTADQLYLAVRLAICEMVLPHNRSIPLVLDDALLSFDDGRLHSALDYLLTAGERGQILLFTCQHREEAYLAGHDDVCVTHLL